MIPEIVASLNAPDLGPPYLVSAQTIDPRLLVYDGTEPSPSTSNLPEIWTGIQDDDLLALAPSPTAPGNPGPTDAIPMDRCICGCDLGPCIPQRDYDRPRTDPFYDDEPQEMILFRVAGKCGYPLSNARDKVYTNLDGRDDKVFIGFKSSISIRVEWLPYEKWTRQIRTLTWKKPPDKISRAKLATEVAKRMEMFFNEMLDKAADPSYYQYRGQPGVIDTDHLGLVALKRVARSSYMPHFRLITPQPQNK